VIVNYEMYVPAGHHRQPRNTSMYLSLAPSSLYDVLPATSVTPAYFPQLPFSLGGTSGLAKLVFWSVTDGTNGEVLPPASLTQTVKTWPMTITAWYYPTGGDGSGPTTIIDDAFSANLGTFIDDDFVDVTSDPSLTSQANVVGIVPTTSPETLVARSGVTSTTEPFSKWVLNGAFMPEGATTLNVPKGAEGVAVAVYQQPASQRWKLNWPEPRLIDPLWWLHRWGPGPVSGGDPIELVARLAAVEYLAATANQVSPQLRGRVLDIALQQVNLVGASIQDQMKGQQQKINPATG
jgi:hypothetical protein